MSTPFDCCIISSLLVGLGQSMDPSLPTSFLPSFWRSRSLETDWRAYFDGVGRVRLFKPQTQEATTQAYEPEGVWLRVLLIFLLQQSVVQLHCNQGVQEDVGWRRWRQSMMMRMDSSVSGDRFKLYGLLAKRVYHGLTNCTDSFDKLWLNAVFKYMQCTGWWDAMQ